MGGGTENHLIVVDLTPYSVGLGTQVAYAMDVAGMYANRNTIPGEPGSPFSPSGLRLGTPLVTTRGMKEAEMIQIGHWIAQVVEYVKDETLPEDSKQRAVFVKDFKARANEDIFLLAMRDEVNALAMRFPLFQM